MKSRFISVLLLITVMLWMVPTPIAMAEVGIENSDPAASDGQVVVLYEEGELPSNMADLSDAKADKAQQKVLDVAVDADVTVEDTIVIEADDEAADDMVVGVVSSDNMGTDYLVEVLG